MFMNCFQHLINPGRIEQGGSTSAKINGFNWFVLQELFAQINLIKKGFIKRGLQAGICNGIKITVVTARFAKRIMYVNTCHKCDPIVQLKNNELN